MITEINSGIYVFDAETLREGLTALTSAMTRASSI